MDALALLLSRLQFAFTASFHIIYHPSSLARGLGWLFSRLCSKEAKMRDPAQAETTDRDTDLARH